MRPGEPESGPYEVPRIVSSGDGSVFLHVMNGINLYPS